MLRQNFLADLGIDKQIFCFDLVQGMDHFYEQDVIYADVLKDKDFHNNKREPRNGSTHEDHDYNIEVNEDGIWYFDEYYSSNGNFRSTQVNNFKIIHGTTKSSVLLIEDNIVKFEDIVKMYLLSNQAEIRALLTLLNAKRSSSINPFRKLPIEMFRLVKNFLI